MVGLSQVLKYMFPNSDFAYDWSIIDRGNGPNIEYWNTSKLGPQPTAAQITTAQLPTSQLLAINSVNAQCQSLIIARFGNAQEQVSRSIGVYGTAEQTALVNGIGAMVDASNVASNSILAATTVAQVEAVTVTWPVI